MTSVKLKAEDTEFFAKSRVLPASTLRDTGVPERIAG
jgi:hypothetical protein